MSINVNAPSFGHHLPALNQDNISIFFKISKDLEPQKITVPKDKLIPGSPLERLAHGEKTELDLTEYDLQNEKEYFVVLSEYLKEGHSVSFYNFLQLCPVRDLDDVTNEDFNKYLTSLCDLSLLFDLLEIQELKNAVEEKVLTYFNAESKYNYQFMQAFLLVGLKCSMTRIIHQTFPRILGQYWAALELKNVSAIKHNKYLVDKCLPHINKKITTLEVRGPCMREIEKRTVRDHGEVLYAIPKEIENMFPNFTKVSWHHQRGALDFNRFIDLKRDKAILIERFEITSY